MTIKEKKIEVLKAIQEVEDDIVTLQNNIEKAKIYLNSMSDESTIEDIKKFDNEYDVENGLKHIELF